MLQTLKLLLPAIIPSWRFFDTIAPSPRIEYTTLKTPKTTPQNWQEFRPRPPQLSAADTLKRLLHNPRWNETLFIVSCAERLIQGETERSCQEIFRRLKTELKSGPAAHVQKSPYLQFRLAFIHREGKTLQTQIAYISPIHNMLEETT